MGRSTVASLLGSLLLSTTQSVAAPLYTSVNRWPQFSANETHFSFYWSLWRGVGESEQAVLADAGGGRLLSRRDVSWRTVDCLAGDVLTETGERFWYLDELTFNEDGQIQPIPEAQRPGYRYLNMLTLNGLHLRGIGPFVAPRREVGEPSVEYQARKSAAYQAWIRAASPKGTRGEVLVKATHRVFAGERHAPRGVFVTIDEYVSRGMPLYPMYAPFAPTRWPVYFDERAHKPHAMTEPDVWLRPDALSETNFQMRFVWSWCDEGPVRAEVFVPPGGLPPPGPNRPGRPDAGTETITVHDTDSIIEPFR